MYEDGFDYTVTSKGYSFAQFARGSTISYDSVTRKKKPNRKKEKAIEKDFETKCNKSEIDNSEQHRTLTTQQNEERVRLVNKERDVAKCSTETESLCFPKSFLTKLGMKDYNDKPDPAKALKMLFENQMSWNTFDKICKVANIKYKIFSTQKEK